MRKHPHQFFVEGKVRLAKVSTDDGYSNKHRCSLNCTPRTPAPMATATLLDFPQYYMRSGPIRNFGASSSSKLGPKNITVSACKQSRSHGRHEEV